MKPDEIKSLILNAYKEAGNSIDLQVSGLTYTILTDEKGNALDVDLKGTEIKIKKNKTYNVGINSYIASSYKFTHKDPGISLFITLHKLWINHIIDPKKDIF